MDNDSLIGILLIIGLISLQAIITAAYAALTNAKTGTLRDHASDGNERASRLLLLISTPKMTLVYYTLNVFVKFGIAALTVLIVVQTNNAPAYTGALLVAASITIVLGDTVPEAIGSTYADRLVYGAGGLMNLLMILLNPLMIVLLRVSKIISALAGSSNLVNTVTEEEIMTLIDAGHTGGTIEDEEKDMIYSVLQLDQTNVSEMMIPRIDVTAVDINQSLEEAGKLFIDSGFSRLPVYEDNLDDVRGLIYAKDLLASRYNGKSQSHKTIRSLMRGAYFVPESKRADELLKELQHQKIHMAIVVDDYGGTAGVVTIEDIIEEIIGDIQDEYDLYEEDEYEQINDNEYTVDAGIDLDDFNNLLDVDLPTEDSDTLGGYIYSHFGRVPEVDDVIDDDKLHLQVVSVDGRRIRKVHAIRKNSVEEPEPVVTDDQSTDHAQAS